MKLEKLRDYLINIPFLERLSLLQDKLLVEIFIVGGIIRDFLLERWDKEKTIELDFAVSRETKRVAQLFARQINGYFVVLDEEKRTYRVLLENKPYQFDFSEFRGENIEEDLYLRDFTINSLAINLKGFKDKSLFKIIDPWKGIEDIEKRIIRVVSDFSFRDDPLRIIRAFTFFQELGFVIEEHTKNLMKESVNLLSKVPGERITEQLARILEASFSYKTIKEMDSLGIMEEIFPIVKEMRGVEQGPYHHLEVWEHSLETLKELERLLEELYSLDIIGKKISEYLKEKIAGERKRLFVLKLGALFHDMGKPRAKEITPEGKIRFVGHEKIGGVLSLQIAERLKLSVYETKDISPKAKLRFFRAGEEESVGIILIALADKFATAGPLTTIEDREEFKTYLFHLLHSYFLEKEIVKPERLLNGHEVMRILKISPGPLVGKILRLLEEAQVEKKVSSKVEAEEFIKTMLEKGIEENAQS
ncbi:MAG: HD domain-containing protein [Candidatus Omnitrophica bacterium]|nr:HD domain-containing protein [Candidatus Omnitrophota bacterium]